MSLERTGVKYFFLGRVFYALEKTSQPLWIFLNRNIQGLGVAQSQRLAWRHGFSLSASISQLKFSVKQVQQLFKSLEYILVRSPVKYGRGLSRFVEGRILSDVKSGSYRGQRFLQGLPVRGQR